MGWHDVDGSDWAWMTTMMVIFWGGLIALVVALIRRPHHVIHATGLGSVAVAAPRAHEILAERLARGEIEGDEYHSRLAALNHHAPG